MKRIVVRLAILAGFLVLAGCSLDFVECGSDGVHCNGEHSLCICATGRCAEPDERCPSELHYVGGRCVPVDLAGTAIESTSIRPRACPVGDASADDGAGDDGAVDDGADGG